MNNPEPRPCIRCGEPTTERLGDTPICRDCYDIRSSCCQEFGGDDMTCPDGDVRDAQHE